MKKDISIQLFSNSLGKEELNAIVKVFNSKWIGSGHQTKMFEQEFGKKIDSQYALCVNNCTSALFLSMKVLSVGRGDEVIIPSINFIGTANAVLEVGAKPVFADVDLDYLNILPEEIKRLRTSKTKAVILLHYGGHPCKMDEISETAKGLYIIEDSANSILSKYKGKNCGTLGDVGCFSFDAMKILVVGDGGAIVLKNEELFNKAREYRYLGIINQQSGIDSFKAKKKKWWEIRLNCTSGRYITNDIASAIGRVQLRKVGQFIKRRNQIWKIYQEELRNMEWLSCPPEPLDETESSYYLYWIRLKPKLRDGLAEFLVENGIYCTFRYYPLHLIKQYNSKANLPNSELLNDSTLNIPLHQNLSDSDVARIIELLRAFSKQ